MRRYLFNNFQIEPAARRIRRADVAVAVEPRVFDLLVYLVEHRDRAIGRDELIAAVWGRSDGSDAILGQSVLKARKLLGDDGDRQCCIRTVPRFGYQWVASTQVQTLPAPASVAVERPEAGPPDANGDAAADASSQHADAIDAVPAAALASTRTPGALENVQRTHRRRVGALALIAGLLAAALVAVAWLRPREPVAPAVAAAPLPSADWILVRPATLVSPMAADEWLELGMLAVLSQSLRELPGRSVIPAETAIRLDAANAPATLRERSGAKIVISPRLRREGTQWLLDVAVDVAGQREEHLEASGDDPVALAEELGARLRLQLDGAVVEAQTRDSLALRRLLTGLDATLLAGQPVRTLELIAASGELATAPPVRWHEAEALYKAGRVDEAEAVIAPLLASRVLDAEPRRAQAWIVGGNVALQRQQLDEAAARFRTALAASTGTGDALERARAYRGIAVSHIASNRLDAAEQDFLRARLEIQSSGDRFALARIDADLGTLALQRYRLDAARDALLQAVRVFGELAASEQELLARLNLSQVLTLLLRPDAALESAEAAALVARGVSSPGLRYVALTGLVQARADTGKLAAAATASTELLALDAPVRGPLASQALLAAARLAALRGHADLAVAFARQAEAAAARPGAEGALALARVLRLRYQLAQGEGDEAAGLIAALEPQVAALDEADRLEFTLAQVEWAMHTDDRAGAATGCERAAAIAQRTGVPRDLRDVAVLCATTALRRGDLAAASRIAALAARWASDDFDCALLLARLARAEGNAALARQRYDRARELARERWSPALQAEMLEIPG